jgi:hypothetical protein
MLRDCTVGSPSHQPPQCHVVLLPCCETGGPFTGLRGWERAGAFVSCKVTVLSKSADSIGSRGGSSTRRCLLRAARPTQQPRTPFQPEPSEPTSSAPAPAAAGQSGIQTFARPNENISFTPRNHRCKYIKG